MPNPPQISVLMSVHNARPFLAEAIESILNQTFADYEFLIMDDGSSDGSGRIINDYARKDKRVRAFFQKNQGLTKSLNTLFRRSRAPFLARMDADAISHPKRLEIELSEIKKSDKTAVVTSFFTYIDRHGQILTNRKPPTEPKKIAGLLRQHDNPLCHPSALIRRSVLESLGGWREEFHYAQDYDLWLRIIDAGYQIRVIPKRLVKMRITAHDLAKRPQQKFFATLAKLTSAKRRAGQNDSLTPELFKALPRRRLSKLVTQLLYFKYFQRFDF